ncbi:MAG: copper amine oxidase N-terminal domain-containing protein, partial [Oscillospiraceae bacterium]|nr:copper amine oxidase N-terminal domain-containing protein [Oscillospiraceae bacterium]
ETEIYQPICDEPGTATHKCLTCGYTSTETVEPKEHKLRYGETIYPSCTEDGEQKYYCTVCGDEESSVIEAPGHSYETITREASCTEAGGTFQFCYVCRDEVGEPETPALGHDWEHSGSFPGNCVRKGKEYYQCTRCNESYTEEGDYGGHNFYGIEWENATCTKEGYVLNQCSLCQYEEKEIIDAKGHDYYLYTFFPASCANEGSESYRCYNCFATDIKVLPKGDHNFVNNKCTDCGRLAAYEERVSINYRRIKIVLDGEEIIPCDGAGNTVEPFIMSSSGTTYLPLRAVSQALGLNVQWDGVANTVTLSSGGTVKTGAGPAGKSVGERKTYITYRNISVFLDGAELSLVNSLGVTVEPFILNSNSSVYLPLRIIGEALGLTVSWDGDTSTVYLDTGK